MTILGESRMVEEIYGGVNAKNSIIKTIILNDSERSFPVMQLDDLLLRKDLSLSLEIKRTF